MATARSYKKLVASAFEQHAGGNPCIVVRKLDQLRNLIFELDSEFNDPSVTKSFDSFDFVFCDGEPNNRTRFEASLRTIAGAYNLAALAVTYPPCSGYISTI